ncbi:hypothetical protein HYPP_02697 [Hyphomicrobium sp. ghe19]|nr:hypothetical protein HYPP_02697 [Hyphomicrobium sp. ghe19]
MQGTPVMSFELRNKRPALLIFAAQTILLQPDSVRSAPNAAKAGFALRRMNWRSAIIDFCAVGQRSGPWITRIRLAWPT